MIFPQINTITINIDNEAPLINTQLKIKLIQCVLPNIPFLPENIIDMHSSYIKINLTPSVIKLTQILSNLSYYKKV